MFRSIFLWVWRREYFWAVFWRLFMTLLITRFKEFEEVEAIGIPMLRNVSQMRTPQASRN